MAASGQVPCGTTPTLLAAAPFNASPGPVGWFSIANGTGATLYLGGPFVSSLNGYAVATSAVRDGTLYSGDQVYGIAGAGTTTASVLQTGT